MTAPDLSGRKPSFGSGVTTPRSISAGRVPIADLGEPTPKPMAVWRANFYRFNRAKDQPPGTAELVAHTIPEFPSTRALWLLGVRQIVAKRGLALSTPFHKYNHVCVSQTFENAAWYTTVPLWRLADPGSSSTNNHAESGTPNGQ